VQRQQLTLQICGAVARQRRPCESSRRHAALVGATRHSQGRYRNKRTINTGHTPDAHHRCFAHRRCARIVVSAMWDLRYWDSVAPHRARTTRCVHASRHRQRQQLSRSHRQRRRDATRWRL
jgi:hypothetical protein